MDNEKILVWTDIPKTKIQEYLLEIADKIRYEENVSMQQNNIIAEFEYLNMKNSARQNINAFFELLDELLYFMRNEENLTEDLVVGKFGKRRR